MTAARLPKICPECGATWEVLAPDGLTCSRGHHFTRDELHAMPDESPPTLPEDSGRERKPSAASRLVRLADDFELFHDAAQRTYATVPVGEHHETHALHSKAIRALLSSRFYAATEAETGEGRAAGAQAVSDALLVLEGRALDAGEECVVYTRIARIGAAVYLDLCDPSWRVIEITAGGWRVVEHAPVKFRRARGMLALPEPMRGGSVDALRSFINADDDTWRLIVAWLVQALAGAGPYPVLCLHGEQGSAKTTGARLVRALIDPSAAPVRSEPRDARDLIIAASNAHIVALDNLSRVQSWLSDALCRLSTGGGFSTRELYSDSEEIIFDAQRPAILTGITELATRADLLDRSLIGNLPRIPEHQRRTETALWAAFEIVRPSIIGALLDAVSSGLRNVGTTKLDRLPRMADFALFVTAAASALGWQPGDFLKTYSANRASANDLALEASQLAKYAQALAEQPGGWSGTATELLSEIDARATDREKNSKFWPRNGRAVSNELRRIAPNLRAAGYAVEFATTHEGRQIALSRAEPPSDTPSAESTDSCVATVASVAPGTNGTESATQSHESATQNASGATQNEPARRSPGTRDARDEGIHILSFACPVCDRDGWRHSDGGSGWVCAACFPEVAEVAR